MEQKLKFFLKLSYKMFLAFVSDRLDLNKHFLLLYFFSIQISKVN